MLLKYIFIIFTFVIITSCSSNKYSNDDVLGNAIINEVLNYLYNPLVKPCELNSVNKFKYREDMLKYMERKKIFFPYDSIKCSEYFDNKKNIVEKNPNLSIVIFLNYITIDTLNENALKRTKNFLGDNYGSINYTLDSTQLDINEFYDVCINQKECQCLNYMKNKYIYTNRRKSSALEIYDFSKIFINRNYDRSVVILYKSIGDRYRMSQLYYLEKFGKHWYVIIVEDDVFKYVPNPKILPPKPLMHC